jgi:flagellar motor switch protein FliG
MESRPSVGGRDTAQSILARAFGSEQAEVILSKALGERRRFFGFLSDLEARQVRALIRDESPAVVAVVLGHMEAEAAASVLSVLPDGTRTAVIRRMAGSGDIDSEVLERVEASLRRKIESLARVDSEGPDGRSTLAEILRHMDHTKEASLLESLQAEDAQLVADIEDRLFTIDTLLLIDDRRLSEILVRYEDRELALMLKGKEEEIRRKVLSNLSERRRATVAEEYRFLGAVPRKEVEEATGTLLTDLKRLESDGTLVVRREGERYI